MLPMLDRLLSQGMTFIILGLIAAGAGGGLYLFFVAWNACLSGQWPMVLSRAIGATACAAAVWWMCKHREELADGM